MSDQKFKSNIEARAYMYRILAIIARHELDEGQEHGWIFGGITSDFDKRRLKTELRKFSASALRRAEKLRQ